MALPLYTSFQFCQNNFFHVDSVFVGEASWVEFLLENGGTLRIAENSLVVLDHLVEQVDGEAFEVTEIRLLKGKVAVRQPKSTNLERRKVEIVVDKKVSVHVNPGAATAVKKDNDSYTVAPWGGQVELEIAGSPRRSFSLEQQKRALSFRSEAPEQGLSQLSVDESPEEMPQESTESIGEILNSIEPTLQSAQREQIQEEGPPLEVVVPTEKTVVLKTTKETKIVTLPAKLPRKPKLIIRTPKKFPPYFCTTKDAVDLRSQSNFRSRILVKLPIETCGSIAKSTSPDRAGHRWLQIEFGDNKGWIYSAFVSGQTKKPVVKVDPKRTPSSPVPSKEYRDEAPRRVSPQFDNFFQNR